MSDETAASPVPVTGVIRIRGLAERACSPDRPLGPGVAVPGEVPLRIEGSSGVAGTAVLRRDDAGVWADGVIHLGGEHAEVMRRDHPAALWPYLAVGVAGAVVEGGVITAGEVEGVYLVAENADPGLPGWEVVTEPPGGCGRCGGVLAYRDRFLRRDGRWTSDKVPDAWCPRCADDWEHLNQLCYRDMGFCGCGDPESVYGLARDVLGLFADRSDAWEAERRENPPFGRLAGPAHPAGQAVRERIGGGDGTFYAVLYWLDHSGLIEHGGSVRGSWPTEKGRYYLGLMRRHSWDDIDEVGLPHEGDECGPGCPHWEASTGEWERQARAAQAKR